MPRNYLVFGSDDGVHWELLNTVEASGGEQALNKAREQEAHRHYGATPERNWTAMTPDVVERPPVVKWKPLNPAQVTVDEVITAEPPKDEQEKTGGAREPVTEPTPEPERQVRKGVL